MIIFDVILLLALAGFVFYGLFFGLIRTVGSLLAVVAGLFLASWFYPVAFQYVGKFFGGNVIIGKIVIYIVIYSVVNRLVSFGFAMLDRMFNLFSIIPFVKTINRLAGALFGLVEGGLVLGIIVYAMKSYPAIDGWLNTSLYNSKIAPLLIKFVETIKPALPGVLSALKSLF